VKQRTGSATKKAVLMALANAASHHTATCEPKINLLAEETELNERTVRRALDDLAEAGLIEREMRHKANGHRAGYVYSFPRLADTAPGRAEGLADAPPGGLPDPVPGQELEQEVQEQDLGEADASPRQPDGPPKLVKVDGRDLAFDALADECGVDPNGNRAREVGIALNGSKSSGLPLGIRVLAWREFLVEDPSMATPEGAGFERLLVGRIRERAARYRAAMNGAMLTPLALAKWWTDVANASAQPHTKFGRRDVSAGEMLAAAERLEQDARKEIEGATD
jgi:DNA-binding transcriptional ArsR family regulator